MTQAGQRSHFIQRAVQHCVATTGLEAMQERLKQTALRDRDLDLEIANDWLAVDQQPRHRLDNEEKAPQPVSRHAAKSN